MKVSKQPAKADRKKPDFTGVPGELVTTVPELHFGTKLRTSPYDSLLDKLSSATAEVTKAGGDRPALKFGEVKARASLMVRARKKGLALEFAEANGNLWVRIVQPANERFETRRDRIRSLLQIQGGANPMQCTNYLREKGDQTIDAQTTASILMQMVREGAAVRGEADVFKLNPARKLAAAV